MRYTVGAEDGREAEVFARVGDVAFDSRENLYVLDRGNTRIVVFDSTGRFLRVIGRRGNGPGELGTPQRMAVTREDEIVVTDPSKNGFSVFGPDGAFRRTIPFARAAVPVGSKLVSHPRGGVVTLFADLPSPTHRGGFGSDRVLWESLGGGAGVALFTRPASSGRGGPATQPVFTPSTRYAVLPDGSVAVASTEAYSIAIVGPRGTTSKVIERAIAPRRVTAGDRQHEMERRRGLAQPGGLTIVGPGAGTLSASARAEVVERLQDVRFAQVIPVIAGLEADRAGNLWIQRSGPNLDTPGPIDIITPDGRYMGTLQGMRLPGAFSRRGRAAYVQTDGLGVQRVVVLRLPDRWR